ncbi:MAG: chlororespiratory reduction protein 7 [Cyanobacteria bacterium J06626_14]
MTDPRLYEHDAFVLLESGKAEEILSPDELNARLADLIESHPDDIPSDVLALASKDEQSQYLADTYCELTIAANRFFQWFAIRLEKD